jgi:hypothetical protein
MLFAKDLSPFLVAIIATDFLNEVKPLRKKIGRMFINRIDNNKKKMD